MKDMYYCNYSNENYYSDVLIVHQDLPAVTTQLYRKGELITVDIILNDICLCRWYGDADPQ